MVHFSVILVVLILSMGNINSWLLKRKSKLSVTVFSLTTNPKYMEANASIVSEDGALKFSLYTNYLVDIGPPMFFGFTVKEYQNEGYKKSFLNSGTDLCSIFKSVSANPVIKTMLDMSKKFGKLPAKCPIKKGLYFVKNLPIAATLFPELLPTDKFRTETSTRTGDGDDSEDIMKLVLDFQFYQNSTKNIN